MKSASMAKAASYATVDDATSCDIDSDPVSPSFVGQEPPFKGTNSHQTDSDQTCVRSESESHVY